MSCCNDIVTIASFLGGISPMVSESAIQYVCARRGLAPEAPYYSLDEREMDLAEGTMYYWLSNLPVGGSTEKVSDGGWSHSEGGWTVSKANIDEWLRKYRSLFLKWDEPLVVASRIRILNLG